MIVINNYFIIMSVILLINETFRLLPNESLSIEYKQFSCINNVQILLMSHLMITCLIEYLLHVHVIFPFHLVMILSCNSYWMRVRNMINNQFLEISDFDRYSLIIYALKKELKLIFVYVYITFLYTWLQLVNSNYTITYFNIIRWLIEASCLRQILLNTIFHYLLCIDDFLSVYNTYYFCTIASKIPLFILMRLAESQSNFFLNRLHTWHFNLFCDFSSQ